MSHTPAKVTIDLKEYNELLKHKETVEKAEYAAKEDIKPYQKAINAICEAISNSRSIDPMIAGRIIEAPMIKGVNMSINRMQKGGHFEVYCEMMPNSD